MSRSARQVTCKLLDLMEEGALDPQRLAEMCLNYMSEAEVADMARINDILDEGEDDSDEVACGGEDLPACD